MEQDKFLAELNDYLIHANQLCMIENALDAASVIQQIIALLRYFAKPNQEVPLIKEIVIMEKYFNLATITNTRIVKLELEVHDKIDKMNVLVNKFVLVDFADGFIALCLAKSKREILISTRLFEEEGLIKFELNSSNREQVTYVI